MSLIMHAYDDVMTLTGRRSIEFEPEPGQSVHDVIMARAGDLGIEPPAGAVLVDGHAISRDDDWNRSARAVREIVLAPGYGEPASIGLLAIGIAAAAAGALFTTRQRVPATTESERERRSRFDRFAPPAAAGETIPLVLGEHKRYGGRVVFETPGEGSDGDGRALILLCLGHGPFQAIGDQTADFDALAHDAVTGIYLNDQPLSQFPGTRVWGRMGADPQTRIPGFDDARSLREVGSGGVALENTSGADRGGADGTEGGASAEAQSTTTSGDVDAVTVRVEFSRGLYEVSSSGQINSRAVRWRARYRTSDDGGGAGSWSDWIVTDIERAEQSPLTSATRIDLPALDTYDIEVERLTREESAGQFVDDMLWTDIVEIIDTDSTYDGLAMLAVELTADERLSSIPRISADVKGYAGLRVWDGVSPPTAPVYTTGYSDNPCALALEWITNSVWGMGARYGDASVDLASLLDLWDYCDDDVDRPGGGTRKRFRCSLVIDQPRDGGEHLGRILDTARAGASTVGGVWRFNADRPQTTPVEVIGDDSILADDNGRARISLRRELTTAPNRPNQIIARFRNEQKDGREDVVVFPADGTEWLGAPTNEVKLSVSVDLDGVTDPDQAASEAVYRLKRLRFLSRTVRLTSALPIVRAQPGDRFDLATSLALYGIASGFIETESVADSVVLDQTVTLDEGTSYTLDVVHPDGTSEAVAVSAAAGTYAGGAGGDAIALNASLATAPSTDPTNPTRYALGETGIVRKPFTCTRVAIPDTERLLWEVEGIEYDEDVYDDTTATVDVPDYSQPQGAMTAPGPVTNLRATERIVTIDSEARRRVEMSWRQEPADARITAGFRVYRRREGSSYWMKTPTVVISTTGATVDLFDTDRAYQFAVVAYSVSGQALSPNDPSVPVTSLVFGLTAAPLDPPGSGSVTRNGDGTYTLSWDAVNGASGYQVLVGGDTGTGLPNDGAEDCLVLARTTDPQLENLTLAPGLDGNTRTFWIRSVGANGRLSLTALELEATGIIAPPGESVIASPAWDLSTDGTADGVTWDAGDSVLRMDAASTPGTWTSPEIDLGSEATRRLAARVRSGNDHTDPLIRTDPFTIPSIAADQWGVIDTDGTAGGAVVGMLMPPWPDAVQAFTLQARLYAGGGWGDWQALGHAGGIVAAMERVQIRVTLSRTEAPYRPSIRTTDGVRAVVMG